VEALLPEAVLAVPADFFVTPSASFLLAMAAPATAPAAAPLATVAITPVRASVALLSRPLPDDLLDVDEDFFALELLFADDEVFFAPEVFAFDVDVVLVPAVLDFVVEDFLVPKAFAAEAFFAGTASRF